MDTKATLVAVYNYIVADSQLLTLMGLTGLPPSAISERIGKTRQLANVADRLPRLAIYETDPVPQNRRVSTHTLVVDIVVPLEVQMSKGLAFDIATRIRAALQGKSICMGFKWQTTLDEQKTAYGWHRTSVLFTYDRVEN